MENQKKPYFLVQTLERTLAVLDLFIKENKPLTITYLSKQLNLHKSIVHRLVATLNYHNYLQQDPETEYYQIGPKAFQLGVVYMNTTNLVEISRPFLTEIVNETGDDAHLAVLEQGSVLYLLNIEPARSYRMYTQFGTRNMISSTALGKSLTAWMNENEVMKILKKEGMPQRTPASITDPKVYMKELNRVRELGYSIDDEEGSLGARCLGAPIFDYTGAVVAAISVSGTIQSIPRSQINKVAEQMKYFARKISIQLGHFD